MSNTDSQLSELDAESNIYYFINSKKNWCFFLLLNYLYIFIWENKSLMKWCKYLSIFTFSSSRSVKTFSYLQLSVMSAVRHKSVALFNIPLSSSRCLIFADWLRVLSPESDEKNVIKTFSVLLSHFSPLVEIQAGIKSAQRKPFYYKVIK